MAANGNFSDLVADAGLWDAHRPDYAVLLNAVGGALLQIVRLVSVPWSTSRNARLLLLHL